MPLMAPKPLPPRWMRRVVLAPAMIGLTVTLLLTLPVWLLVAAAASPLLPGKLRALRVLWVVLVWLMLESACLLALFGLWLAGEHLGLAGDRASDYAKDVVMADFESPGDGDMLRRIALLREADVPGTNYGLFLAWAKGLLPRALEPFPVEHALYHSFRRSHEPVSA